MKKQKPKKLSSKSPAVRRLRLTPVSGYVDSRGTFYATLSAAEQALQAENIAAIADAMWDNLVRETREDETDTEDPFIDSGHSLVELLTIKENQKLLARLVKFF